MSIIKKGYSFTLILILYLGSFVISTPVLAASPCDKNINVDYHTIPTSQEINNSLDSIKIVFTGLPVGSYRLRFGGRSLGISPIAPVFKYTDWVDSDGKPTTKTTIIVKKGDVLLDPLSAGPQVATLVEKTAGEFCGDVKYDVKDKLSYCKLQYYPPDPRENEQIGIRVTVAPPGTYFIGFRHNEDRSGIQESVGKINIDSSGQGTTFIPPFATPKSGIISLVSGIGEVGGKIVSGSGSGDKEVFCSKTISVVSSAGKEPRTAELPPEIAIGIGTVDCSGGQCSKAAGQECDDKQPGIKTAIGCVPTDPEGLIKGLLRFATGVAGGIALLLMVFGAFQMITSSGNPENLKKGQEQFTSAIIGLLFIVFSVLLLKIIGVDILNIPGFR